MSVHDERTLPLLGVDCYAGGVAGAAAAVVERARAGEGGYACLCNVHVLVSAHHDPRLRDALGGARWVFPDGWPLAWLQRRAGTGGAERVAGAELMQTVIGGGVPHGLRHFLFGSTPAVLDRLAERLRREHPDVVIAGAISPPFGTVEAQSDARILEEIAAARPDVIWCALGAPKQELWMARNAEALAPAVVVGVGAAYDFLAGSKPRAPEWMQLRGLEWLFRLRTEPRRLAGRYARTNAEFLVRASLHLARKRPAA